MKEQSLIEWLRTEDEGKLQELWQNADRIRRETVGDSVHLRGLLEISSYCARRCSYCGLNAGNTGLTRYRMSRREIIKCVEEGVEYGYGTIVMQAGEDYGIKTQWLADLVREIKETTPLAVTLSMGERPLEDLIAWREAGADRYLLRFETSDPELYNEIHPPLPGQQFDRFDLLNKLKALGYEVGSGVMIGIPGQSYESLARDIALFAELDLDMIGVGPYIAHPDTPLATRPPIQEQVPSNELMVYKVVALARQVCPQANIPSTTALATINTVNGRELGLQRGANVVMPNLTPVEYRELYQIYPGKACISETAAQCRFCLSRRITAIGRIPGRGRGDRAGKSDKSDG